MSGRRRIAFQGERGAFSEEAVYACFGRSSDVDAVPYRDFAAVSDAVIRHETEFGVLPVENSTAGSVAAAYDILAGAQLTICGEWVQPIRLHLLGLPGATVASLRRVLSHPVALAQCSRFLDDIGAERIAVYDTAGAAWQVARDGDRTAAAVAGAGAAAQYGLDVLAADVHDRADNQTRFLVVCRSDAPTTALQPGPGTDFKTALLMETEHRAGALVEVLSRFAEHGISLTHIESRPGDLPWHYRFVIEIQADARAIHTRSALEQAGAAARSLIVLGSFPMLGGNPERAQSAGVALA